MVAGQMTIQAIPNPPQDDIGTIRTLRRLTPLIIGTFAEAEMDRRTSCAQRRR